MLTTKVWFGTLLFGAILAVGVGSELTRDNVGLCQVNHQTKGPCEEERMGKDGSVGCIFDEEGKLIGKDERCVVNYLEVEKTYLKIGARSHGNKDEAVAEAFTDSIPKDVSYEDFQKLAGTVPVDTPELGNAQQVDNAKRSMNFNGMLLGLGGLGGLGLGLGKPLFPECPVHVKYCYRVPCGGYGNKYMENNPKQCLSDPRCCYDYKLAYMKKIFGPKFMGGAPSCYYGATSKQWVYITNYFKPWNAWYGKFILQAFESFFNTNAYDFAGKFACESTFGRKAYPVGSKSKLQCNLVSGCWDETLPEGSQCLMASSIIQSLFGRREVYPSLFTDDPSDTKCSADWYQYGPKAYNRMPCGAGPAPPKISSILSDWCPVKECCLNYAALSQDEKSEFMSYYIFMQNFGSGGFPHLAMSQAHPGAPAMQNPFGGWHGPGQQTPYDPRIFYYLLTSSSTSDLSSIFCPYKHIVGAGIFPDLSEYAEGCCEIPKCYHKKKLVRPSYPYPYPKPTRRPTPPPVKAAWGAWEECRATCGTTGIRYRQCYVGHRQQPGLCPGPSSQQCMGKPCPIQYYWGQWTAAGPCSATCGSGYMVYRRSCYGGGKEVDSYLCNGDSQKSEPCSVKQCEPEYSWSQEYVQMGPCSVTCGQGYAVWGLQCVSSGGQVVSNQFCPGRPSQQTRLCQMEDCPAVAQWGEWKPITECGATCGPRGLRVEQRSCYVNGQKTDSSACEGEDEMVRRCAAPDCPTEYYWTGYVMAPCALNSEGYCTRRQSRRCYEFIGGRYVYVNPQSKCGDTGKSIPCDPQQCAGDNGEY